MTRSHAKSNTNGAVFTYYERSQTGYGSKTQRIGADSMRKIDSCCLCLRVVGGGSGTEGKGVACGKGHVFCRECVLESLISQKNLIKSHQASLLSHSLQEESERTRAREEARERVLRDFERGLGLAGSSGSVAGGAGAGPGAESVRKGTGEEKKTSTDNNDEGEGKDGRGTKRKFEFDRDAVERLAREAEEAAMRSIEREQAEARRSKLPSFWLPTLTPEAQAGPLKDIKLQTLCKVGEEPHVLTSKGLMPVTFTYSSEKSTNPSSTSTPICPSCSKEMSNSTRCVLLTSRTPASTSTSEPAAKKQKSDKKDKDKDKEPYCCGHVICGTCADTIVKPGKQCAVCEAVIRPDKDMIELGKEGTGFAAAGGAQVTKPGLRAF